MSSGSTGFNGSGSSGTGAITVVGGGTLAANAPTAASNEFVKVGVDGSIDHSGYDHNSFLSSSTLLNQVGSPSANVSLNSHKITGLAVGTTDGDAAEYTQMNNAISAAIVGRDWKESVLLCPSVNINVAAPGSPIDGIILPIGFRILLINQTTATENGIYIYNSGTSPMTRATDADTSAKVTSGMSVVISQGTYAGFEAVLTTADPITLGTTNLVFSTFKLAGYTGTSNRITVTGNTIDISGSYAGQNTITTVGTIGTGIWQGTVISPVYGGTGIANNVASTLTISGNFGTTFTVTGTTALTLPTSGTLATTASNVATATALATQRLVNGIAFDGTSNVLIPPARYAKPQVTTPSGLACFQFTGTSTSSEADTLGNYTLSFPNGCTRVSPTFTNPNTGNTLPFEHPASFNQTNQYAVTSAGFTWPNSRNLSMRFEFTTPASAPGSGQIWIWCQKIGSSSSFFGEIHSNNKLLIGFPGGGSYFTNATFAGSTKYTLEVVMGYDAVRVYINGILDSENLLYGDYASLSNNGTQGAMAFGVDYRTGAPASSSYGGVTYSQILIDSQSWMPEDVQGFYQYTPQIPVTALKKLQFYGQVIKSTKSWENGVIVEWEAQYNPNGWPGITGTPKWLALYRSGLDTGATNIGWATATVDCPILASDWTFYSAQLFGNGTGNLSVSANSPSFRFDGTTYHIFYAKNYTNSSLYRVSTTVFPFTGTPTHSTAISLGSTSFLLMTNTSFSLIGSTWHMLVEVWTVGGGPSSQAHFTNTTLSGDGSWSYIGIAAGMNADANASANVNATSAISYNGIKYIVYSDFITDIAIATTSDYTTFTRYKYPLAELIGYPLQHGNISDPCLAYAGGRTILFSTWAGNDGGATLEAIAIYSYNGSPDNLLGTGVGSTSENVAQIISSVIASGSAVSMTTTATAYDVTSIDLPPGKWDVTGVIDYHPGATTVTTYLQGGSSLTSATLGAQDSSFLNPIAIASTSVDPSQVIPTVRYDFSTAILPTKVYLVVKAGFTISTLTAYGTIRATKVG